MIYILNLLKELFASGYIGAGVLVVIVVTFLVLWLLLKKTSFFTSQIDDKIDESLLPINKKIDLICNDINESKNLIHKFVETNRKQHNALFGELSNLKEEWYKNNKPLKFSHELHKIIEKQISLLKRNDFDITINTMQFLHFVKEEFVKDYYVKQSSSFKKYSEDEYLLMFKNIHEKFVSIFGLGEAKKHFRSVAYNNTDDLKGADKYVVNFLHSIEELNTLRSNSKKERYRASIIKLFYEISANMVHYSLVKSEKEPYTSNVRSKLIKENKDDEIK